MAIPISRWGKDHWSTFAFVAHWCVEYGARGFDISSRRHRRQMRVDAELHPHLAHIDGECPATRLAGGEEVSEHDDYTCIDDMEAAGLVRWEGTGFHPIIFMTSAGLEVAAALNAHKTRGGSFATFHLAEASHEASCEGRT